jgi:hypothetical protein
LIPVDILVSCPIKTWLSSGRCRISWRFFKAVRAALALATSLSELIRRSDPPRRKKNSQLATARRVAMKMGRRLRCSSVTYRSDMRPPRVRQLPDRRPILIATKAMLLMGQDTRAPNAVTTVTHRLMLGLSCASLVRIARLTAKIGWSGLALWYDRVHVRGRKWLSPEPRIISERSN